MHKLFIGLGTVAVITACLNSALFADHRASAETSVPSRHATTIANSSRSESTSTADAKDDKLESPWDDFVRPSKPELRRQLNAMQYNVTQRKGTEPAFRNTYWNHHEAGIYVDIVSGEPLFSSSDKFDSGTGWPSFVQPLDSRFVEFRIDRSLFSTRMEVRSKLADSHLGHVFADGPVNRGGKRYCMNSAAMRFVPKNEMEAEGYGEYLPDVIDP